MGRGMNPRQTAVGRCRPYRRNRFVSAAPPGYAQFNWAAVAAARQAAWGSAPGLVVSSPRA